MASYQFLPVRPSGSFMARVRARDPFWYRAGEVVFVVAVLTSNMLTDAIEDAAARIYRSLTRRH